MGGEATFSSWRRVAGSSSDQMLTGTAAPVISWKMGLLVINGPVGPTLRRFRLMARATSLNIVLRSIDEHLVHDLVARQFPRWVGLRVRPMPKAGWDNRMFRLGEDMLVRLPSAAAYEAQVDKEQRWLPVLAPGLAHEIPAPLAIGQPALGFPWKWSVYRFIEGEPATSAGAEPIRLARELASFFTDLHALDTQDGPAPGAHNFHRGASLSHYDREAREAIDLLGARIRTNDALEAWKRALATTWTRPGVWVHGDIAPGNLLARDGRLAAVIDFGNLCVGDPACDLSIAWTFFSGASREAFHQALPFDEGTWVRARGWAIWKALVVAAGLSPTNAPEFARPLEVLESALAP
jgi:aminoglycoside phosphotransferase (APT) family kinase protein